jgi:hypothetical protein
MPVSTCRYISFETFDLNTSIRVIELHNHKPHRLDTTTCTTSINPVDHAEDLSVLSLCQEHTEKFL